MEEGEARTEELFGAVEPGFDGFLGATHDGSNLSVGLTVVFGEHERGALIGGQLGNGGGNVCADFVHIKFVRDGFVCSRRVGQVVERFGGVALPPAEPVDAEVVREREQPRRKFPTRPVRADLLIDADKHFLGDIISFGEVHFWYLLTETLHAKLSKV